MRLWLALLLVFGVSATSALKIDVVPRGCVPTALNFEYAYRVKMALVPYAWTRVLRIDFPGDEPGHALAVFVAGDGNVWVYDTLEGSRPLHTKSHDLCDITVRLRAHNPRIITVRWLD